MDCRGEQNKKYGFHASSKAVLWVQGHCASAGNGTQDYIAEEGATLVGLFENGKEHLG
jgi:hypothetical protein